MSELDARKQTILRAVIFEYVAGAEPVGSELIVQKHPLGVRSATVRNELAEMSEMGYLEQPHTSAGRIPSDLGYRYFVDRLIVEREIDAASKQKLKGAAEEGDVLQALLRETTGLLSRLTRLLAAAAIARDRGVKVRSAIVSAIGPHQALFVLMLSNGQAETRMVECPIGLTLQDVGQVNDLLAQTVSGKTLKAVSHLKAPVLDQNQSQSKLIGLVWTALRSIARELTKGIVLTEGEEFMIAQPEFQRDVKLLSEVLNSIGDTDALYDALQQSGDSQLTVTIGKENKSDLLRPLSIVRKSFYVGEDEAGVIAIIGPTRMSYEFSIPLVNYTAQALSESLTRFLGG
jgi:heat-inducible transcriptional repressor